MSTIQILTPTEIRNYELPPRFDSFSRKKFFALPIDLMKEVQNLRNPSSKIAFILQAGYFRAAQRFFGSQFYESDIAFVAGRLSLPNPVSLEIPKQNLARNRKIIAEFYGFRSLTKVDQKRLILEITDSVKQFARPAEVFRQTIKKLNSRKFILPGYDFLSTNISREIYRRKLFLSRIIKESLSIEQKQLLDSLLEKEESTSEIYAGSDSEKNQAGFRAKLTLLKNPSQSLKPADIKSNLNDWNLLQAIYKQISDVIVKLDLSLETLRYYANSVLKSELFQISRQKDETRYLHLLAFIASQTFRYQDAVVDSFLQTVQNITNSATQELREKIFRERREKRSEFRSFVQTVQMDVFEPLVSVDQIVTSEKLLTDEKIDKIKAVLLNFHASRPVVENLMSEMLADTDSASDDYEFYNVLQQKSLTLQKRTADIIRLLQVDEKTVNKDLFNALQHFQINDGHLDGRAPREFLSEKEQNAVNSDENKFPVSLYKFLLFQKIAGGIKSGAVNFTASHKYRSLEDYLIPLAEWETDSVILPEKAELAHWQNFREVQAELSKITHQTFLKVNQKLKNNPWFKPKTADDWIISTPPVEKSELSGLKHYFPTRLMVSLGEVFRSVNQATNFLEEFTHWQSSSKLKRPSNRSFCAAIIGMGCEIGIGKISHIAKNISETELENTVNWFLSNENLLAANSHLVDFIGHMELPNLYRRNQYKLHTSSDGQKYGVSVPSLNANYSFKYFGQEKGVSVYSFIDERHLLFYSTVISSSEREAAYVIDGLLHNEAVKSDIHSTDSHGFTEVVFAVTHLLGFTFAPRLKTLSKHQLYSFEKKKIYSNKGCTILPDAYINTKIIEDNWDSILRFVATIKLKRTTASQLFKRLNSYSNQHPLYQALKEFGKIIKTLFILRYVDDLELRQSIEKQLSKIEQSQKFAKAVACGNNQEFSEGDKHLQDIIANCRRLIENMVICWNYLYLTQKLTELSTENEKQELLETFKNSSIITWQHINFHGEYDFSEEKTRDSIGFNLPKILSWKLEENGK
ncbi:MAG: Tn3 family transposase [Pyrinomonadaceae bacterium]|nr:Tn3 family transposase [Pyrinomonadaceae bacterium]